MYFARLQGKRIQWPEGCKADEWLYSFFCAYVQKNKWLIGFVCVCHRISSLNERKLDQELFVLQKMATKKNITLHYLQMQICQIQKKSKRELSNFAMYQAKRRPYQYLLLTIIKRYFYILYLLFFLNKYLFLFWILF